MGSPMTAGTEFDDRGDSFKSYVLLTSKAPEFHPLNLGTVQKL